MADKSDYFELAMIVCGKNPENEVERVEFEHDADGKLLNTLGVDSKQFKAVAGALIKYAGEDVSPITGKHRRGFANKNEWIVYAEVE